MTAFPTPSECRTLLAELDAPRGLVRHVCAVAGAAGALAALCGADIAHCVAAGWLHDVGKAPGAAAACARLSGKSPESLAAMDHGLLGAALLRGMGGRFAGLAPAVERHVIDCVVRGPAPATPEEKVVFLADKLADYEFMGFRGRTADILRRHGERDYVREALPGSALVLWDLASRACVGPWDLELAVRLAPAPRSGADERVP